MAEIRNSPSPPESPEEIIAILLLALQFPLLNSSIAWSADSHTHKDQPDKPPVFGPINLGLILGADIGRGVIFAKLISDSLSNIADPLTLGIVVVVGLVQSYQVIDHIDHHHSHH